MGLYCNECERKLTLWAAIKRFIYNFRLSRVERQYHWQMERDYRNLLARHNEFLEHIGGLSATQRDIVSGFNQLATQVNMIAEKLNSPAKRQKKQHNS